MQYIIDVLVFVSLVIFYMRVNRGMEALVKCEEHLRVLAYQGTKRERSEQREEQLS